MNIVSHFGLQISLSDASAKWCKCRYYLKMQPNWKVPVCCCRHHVHETEYAS